MKRLALLFSVLLITNCNSTKKLTFESCYEYDMVLKEFSSKFEFSETGCYTYKFEKDSTKYIDYNEFGGKTKFMDYRLNEILYYQHKLTNEFLDLSTTSKNCQQLYSRQDIVTLFGGSYDYNEHYMTLNYNQCVSPKSGYHLNYIQFKFNLNDKLESININMYQM